MVPAIMKEFNPSRLPFTDAQLAPACIGIILHFVHTTVQSVPFRQHDTNAVAAFASVLLDYSRLQLLNAIP